MIGKKVHAGDFKILNIVESLLNPHYGLTAATINLSCNTKDKIADCFISFKGTGDLTITSPERLPESSEKFIPLKTDNGDVQVSRIDGYRILYNNSQSAALVNLKVELSETKSYDTDQKGILDNLKYLISQSQNLTTTEPIEIEKNGYKIFGLNRNTTDSKSSTLGIYIMFPGNNITVYFYFNNLDRESRNYNDLQEFITVRDKFFDEYTKHIKNCKN